MSFDHMHAKGGNVRFPYDEALALSRTLWALAQRVEDTQNARVHGSTKALDGWQGKFAQHFQQSMLVSSNDAVNSATTLRNAANGLATSWAKANYQQQLDNYSREVQQKRDHDNNFVGHVHDFLFGADLGRPPHPPETPKSPGFDATDVPQAYVP